MTPYLSSFIEFIIVYYITRTQLNKSLRPNVNDVVMLLLYTFISGYIVSGMPFISFACGQLFLVVYMVLAYNLSILSTIILALITAVLIMFFEIISAALISFIPIPYIHINIAIFGSLLTLILIILFSYFEFVHQLYNRTIKTSFIFKLALFNTFFIFIVCMTYLKANTKIVTTYAIAFACVFIFVAVLNIACILYENRIIEKQNQLISYQKNYPIYNSLLTDIRASQHEYVNRMHTINMLTHSCKTLDELTTALNKMVNVTKAMPAYPLLQINMPILAASLYHQYIVALEDNIHIQFDVQDANLVSQIDEVLLSDLASVLLQNAVEESIGGDIIYVRILTNDSKTTFEVRNPVKRMYPPEEVSKFFKKNYTTKRRPKSDGLPHGLGLSFLKATVHRNDGKITADCIEFRDQFFMIMKIEV